MNSEFAVILQKNRNLGWILLPFIISNNEAQEFSSIEEYITLDQVSDNCRDYEIDIIKTINEYDEKILTKLFSKKKKLTAKEFIDNIPEEIYEKHLRPYIEKRIAKCVDLIEAHNIPFFYKKAKSNLYPEDRIHTKKHIPSTIFNFEKSAMGLKYHLSVILNGEDTTLPGKKYILLSNTPCRIIIESHLYAFEDINGNKLLPFFNKEHISIPEKFEEKYFTSFILNAIKSYSVRSKGFDIKTYSMKPSVCLSISNDLRQLPILFLTFHYNEIEVTINTADSILVRHTVIDNKHFYEKHIRDTEFENSIINYFTKNGLSITGESFLSVSTEETDETILYTQLLKWISKHREWFNSNEIKIKNIDDKTFYNSTIDLKIDIKTYTDDWFDINAIVNFGEFQIPFKRLRQHILNNNQLLRLPNGEIAIIPEEWFSKYKDLFLFDKNENNELIKINKFHFNILENENIRPDKNIKNKLIDFSKDNRDSIEIPENVNAKLRSYQETGFKWLYALNRNKLGGCLADDMGLGKTLQTLTLLQKSINDYIPEETASPRKATGQLSLFDTPEYFQKTKLPASLIVMPASLLHNWNNEARKFTPGLHIYKYIGNVRDKGLSYFDRYDIVLTTYGLLRNDIDAFEKYKFHYIILDESQVIKNPASKIYNAVLRLKSSHKLVLTGTPIENSLIDLWAQMNFINKDVLGSLNFFKNEFAKKIERNDSEIKERLQNIIKPFILRREKKEVARDLPDLTEQIRFCKMTENQNKFYESEKSKIRNLIYDSIEKNGVQKSSIHILQGLTRLRLIANHPKMLDDADVVNSGKFEEVNRIISNLLSNSKHKILIFSSFVKQLELYAAHFKKEGVQYSLLTGETKDRESVVHQFQKDEDYRIFLISIKAGGVGLNLTSADYVFILDPWWNPAIESQAVSRAHRIGQQNKVFVYRFISENTIEEKIKTLQEKKAELAKTFVNSDENFNLSQENIDFLFK